MRNLFEVYNYWSMWFQDLCVGEVGLCKFNIMCNDLEDQAFTLIYFGLFCVSIVDIHFTYQSRVMKRIPAVQVTLLVLNFELEINLGSELLSTALVLILTEHSKRPIA